MKDREPVKKVVEKPNMCKCDNCGSEFLIRQKEVRCEEDGVKLCGQPVTVRAFMCPECGKMYVVSVMTDDMIERFKVIVRKEEKEKVIKEEKELRRIYINSLTNGSIVRV